MVTYQLTNRRETEDSVRFDLEVRGGCVLQQVMFMTIFHYVLQEMDDADLYQEKDEDGEEEKPLTGAALRAMHVQEQAQLAAMPHMPCVRCEGPTAWIGYQVIAPYGPKPLQHTYFSQCGQCGLYRQVGFANGDDWKSETYRNLMQERAPFVRTARDPFLRNDTLRVTTRDVHNFMGRVNLNGYEFNTGERISIYDQDLEAWRDGWIQFGYEDQDQWYFTSRDGAPDVVLKMGMKAKFPDDAPRSRWI
jgi:hypothetical protein